MKFKTNLSNFKSFIRPYVCHHCDVTRHIRPNRFKLYPQKQVSKWSQVSSQGPTPLLGELLKVLSFLTQFQKNFNSSMSFSRHTRTHAFSSSRPKTRAVWVRKEPKTQLSFLFVLYFNSFSLKQDFLCLISYLLLESYFYASAPFYHAFMHLHISFMLSCCLSVFVWLFSFYFVLFFQKKIKNQKNTKTTCVCVHWYLCTLDGH